MASPLVCPPPPLAPQTHTHTHFSLHPPSAATAVVRALRWEIKKKLLLSPCRRDGRLFLSLFSLFFFSLPHSFCAHTRGSEERRGKRGEKTNNVEERKKAILRAVAFHHTTNNSPSPPAPAPSTATLVVRERE